MSSPKPEFARPLLVGDWTVEPSMNRVTRGDESTQLQPRVAEVLVYLAGRAGEVATRQEILDAVWRREFVADNSVSQAIAELRSALGDDARDPRYIETIPKRGYRLIVPVGLKPEGETTNGNEKPGRRYLLAAAVVVVAAIAVGWMVRRSPPGEQIGADPAAGPRIVVMPFEMIGPEDRAYFADGLTEEITCRLALAPGIRVISRTTAVQISQAGMTVDEIGRELGVDFVLEGSVRWEEDDEGGERVRVTPQLIRVKDDTHVWTDSYDRHVFSAFAVQADIGAHVLEHLGVNLSVDSAGTDVAPYQPDPVAYDAYLHATAAGNGELPAQYVTAISWYRRAVEVDPSYGLAWAGLARSCCLAYYFRSDRTPAMEEAAREAAARAGENQPDGAEAYTARGDVLYFLDRDYRAAGEAYRRAYEISPAPGLLVNIARVERRLGAWDTALTTLTSALERSPLSAALMVEIGSTHLYLRNYDEALLWFDRVGERNPASMMHRYMAAEALQLRDGNAIAARRVLVSLPEPKGDFWWSVLFEYEYFDRRFEQALECAARVSEAAESSPPRGLLEALALARLDQSSLAVEAAQRGILATETRLHHDPGDREAQMWLALAIALSGDREEAIAGARRAAAQTPIHRDALLGGDLAYMLAVVASMSGDADLSIETLQALLSTPSLVSVESLRQDPMFDDIRDNPGFDDLLTRHSDGED